MKKSVAIIGLLITVTIYLASCKAPDTKSDAERMGASERAEQEKRERDAENARAVSAAKENTIIEAKEWLVILKGEKALPTNEQEGQERGSEITQGEKKRRNQRHG